MEDHTRNPDELISWDELDHELIDLGVDLGSKANREIPPTDAELRQMIAEERAEQRAEIAAGREPHWLDHDMLDAVERDLQRAYDEGRLG